MPIEFFSSKKFDSTLSSLEYTQLIKPSEKNCKAYSINNSQDTLSQSTCKKSFWLFSNITYFFLYPWIKLGQFFSFIGEFLRQCLFCCFHFIPKIQPLDWKETFENFKIIYRICFSKNKITSVQQENFYKAIKDLHPDALNRFQQHIIFSYLLDPKKSIGCMALEKPITDRAEQEKWFNENRKDINFTTIFYNKIDQNKTLFQKASQNYYKELELKNTSLKR